MFSQELQKLIEASLTDGVLTDKEREVIRKRALLEGIDPDEVDVLLDSELQKLQQKQEAAVKKVKKCPNCGEIIPTMAVKCSVCGYEFREQEANGVVERFAQGLRETKATNAFAIGFGAKSKKAEYVRTFVLPNNAEDLYEMIIYLTNAIKTDDGQDQQFKPALTQKLNECRDKVKMLYPNDPRFAGLLEATKMNWWQAASVKKKLTIISVVCWIALIGGCYYMCSTGLKEEEQEKQEMTQSKNVIEAAISAGELDKAFSELQKVDTKNKEEFVSQYQHLINAFITGGDLQKAKSVVNEFGRPSSMSNSDLKDAYMSFYAPIYEYYMDKGDNANAERFSPAAVNKMFDESSSSSESSNTSTTNNDSSSVEETLGESND